MNKTKLLLIPFSIGLALFICSWFSSFPLSVDSVNDVIFNHLSILYWISLPLLFSSMYLMAVNVKSHLLKWLLTVGIVLTFFSLSYFFSMLPSSDSSWFRGQTQYFIETGSLNPSMINHLYFQWPAFFVLSNVATSVSGLGLIQLEFLQYALIGFILATTLYVYFAKIWKNGSVLSVIAFFVVMFAFLNYQDVPFSFALGLLFVLFMLETRQGSLA